MAVLASLLAPTVAFAGVGKITSPLVTKGKFATEYELQRYGDDSAGKSNAQDHELELKYGFTDRLEIAVLTEAFRGPNAQFGANAHGAKFKYTTTNQKDGWWLSSGIYGKYTHATDDSDADGYDTKILLNRHQGDWDFGGNIAVKRELGGPAKSGVKFATAFDALYKINPYISPGMEWHASYGKLNRFNDSNDQEHYVGPVIYGQLWAQEASKITYVLGHAWGLTDASADDATRLELEYSTKF